MAVISKALGKTPHWTCPKEDWISSTWVAILSNATIVTARNKILMERFKPVVECIAAPSPLVALGNSQTHPAIQLCLGDNKRTPTESSP
jgi:hypothetical protein